MNYKVEPIVKKLPWDATAARDKGSGKGVWGGVLGADATELEAVEVLLRLTLMSVGEPITVHGESEHHANWKY